MNSRGFPLLPAYAALIFAGLIVVSPFVWALLSSFKSANEAIAIPPVWLPDIWRWSNYAELFELLPFGAFYWNTFRLVLLRIFCAVLFSTMAAYAFARIPFFGSKFPELVAMRDQIRAALPEEYDKPRAPGAQ